MRSKSLDRQRGERDRPEGSRRVELSHLLDGNNRCLPDEKKGMRRPGKIENVKKIHARTQRCFSMGVGNFVWARGSGREKVGNSLKKFSKGKE